MFRLEFYKVMLTISLACTFTGFLVLYSIYYSSKENSGVQKLVVGIDSGSPPYEVINAEGSFEGFDIDVAQVIAEKLNKKLVIRDMCFDGLIVALNQKVIDLIISRISISHERLQEINLVHYQGNAPTTIGLYFLKKLPQGVTSLDDIKKLSNRTICTLTGFFNIKDFLKSYDHINIKCFEHVSDLILEVKYGKAIAIALDTVVGKSVQKQYPELAMFEVPLPVEYSVMGYGIGIAKSNTELTNQIKAIIDQCKNDGTLNKLEQKWNCEGTR